MKKVTFITLLQILVISCPALAQQLPSGLVNIGIPQVLTAQLPTCNAAAGPLLYKITDSANACTYGNAVAGSGSITCTVQCDATNSTWRMAQPPDIAPPTTINLLTSATAATGDAQFAINNGTTHVGSLIFSSASLNLTTGCSGTTCVGANVTVTEQDATVTSGSGWPQYNGCWKQCTIASVTNATTGVCNTPSASSGTCSASTGLNGSTGADPDTNATIVVWDGKDQTAFAAENTAAGADVTAYNTGATIFLPCGTYVIGANNAYGNVLSAGITVQGQSPSCVTVINPYFTGNSMIMSMNSGDKVRGITFSGTDTNAHADGFSRRTSDGLIVFNPNGGIDVSANDAEVSDNVFEYVWSDQGGVALNAGIGYASGSPPCAFGQYANASNVCTPEPTGNVISGNYFHNCESWGIQLSGGVSNLIVDNQFLDCGPVNQENGSTSMSNAMFNGNLIGWNDGHCDATGDGVYQDAVTASLNRTPYDGCTMYSQDDGRSALNFSTTRFIGNHLHADNTAPSAGFSCGGATIATVRSNTCTSGEHCANALGGTGC